MDSARVKLQKLPNGKHLIIVVNQQGFPEGGNEELSEEETTKRLRESGASESEIKRLFAEAENITSAEATILEDEEEE